MTKTAALKSFLKKPSALYICYTLGFLVLFFGMFCYILLTGRTTVVGHDGITQYYSGFVASSRIYKDFLKSLLSGNGINLKMWEPAIGFGDDTITTLNMYGFADPFGIISIFFPESMFGGVFTFVYFVKSYLTGLGFVLFARYHRAGRLGSLTGAYIYTFSMFPMVFGSSECNFMIPVLCLPYMLLGSDLILDKGKPYMLIISTGLIATMNFYFLYMAVVAAVAYTLFRYFTEVRPLRGSDIFKTFMRFFISYIEALLLSAFILLPVIMQLMTAGRYGESKEVALAYDGAYYFRFPSAFLGFVSAEGWTAMGYTAVAFLSVVLMFLIRGKYKRSKVLFIMITLGLFIPACGFAMTAFAYTNNRWVFIYDLAVSYIISKLLYEFEDLSARRLTILAAAAGVYLLFAAILPIERGGNVYITSLSLCLTFVIIAMIKALAPQNVNLLRIAIAFCAAAGLLINSYFQFMGYGGHDGALKNMYLSADLDDFRNGFGLDKLTAGDDSLYRVDETHLRETRNSGQLRSTMTTGMYYSLINPHHSDFYLNNGILCNHTWNSSGFDSRSILNAVAAVKYYVIEEGKERKAPFDFYDTGKKMEAGGRNVTLYENENPMPFGFAMTARISPEKLEELPVEQRQEAMLFGAVADAEGVPEAEFEPISKSVLKDIDWGENIEGSLEALKVKKDEAVAVLTLKEAPESELYVVVTDMDFHGTNRRGQYTDTEWQGMSQKEKMGIIVDDITRENSITTYLAAFLGEERVNDFRYGNRSYQYYCGQRNFVMNLGTVTPKDGDQVKIEFSSAGDYHFDSIDVVALPTESIRAGIASMHEYPMTDMSFGVNSFEGRIRLDKPSVVEIAMPHSTGWRAYVDGTEVPLLSVNTYFMGVEAGPGEHEIRLQYRTPWIREGLLLTLIGWLLLIAAVIKKFKFRCVP
ncbi:MAG: YfhO family protein [Lachnospiraceae bacterium]|nr:YfhO family protein [Lachnospiraceae bacterium]